MNTINKKEIKKILPTIFKFIEDADEIEFSMNNDIFELPNRKTWGMEVGYDGNSTITFNLYHQKRNQIKEVTIRANK